MIPDEDPITATLVVELVHVPPPNASLTVMVNPSQTVDGPEMDQGVGITVTV